MKTKGILLSLIALFAVFALSGCNSSGSEVDTTAPTVLSTVPEAGATDVAINTTISARFSEAMDHETIVAENFTVLNGATPVVGNVTYDIPNNTAIFAPNAILVNGSEYTATLSVLVTDEIGNPMEAVWEWSFTTTATAGAGPSPVVLGTAGNFAILAKTAISTIPSSVITGDIGLSPAAESFMEGFSQTKATGYSTSPQVVGFMYAADMTPPTPTMMTTAISDMEAAYTNAAGRVSGSTIVNLGSGAIGGLTLAPGLYNWTSGVTSASDFTISGGANDVWIFQVNGNLTVAPEVSALLDGGALAKNIFWQVVGQTTLGTTSHFEGVILGQYGITFETGSSLNGKALAQTRVDLDQATVTDVE